MSFTIEQPHVITLIHRPGGRFTIDCRSRDHGEATNGLWFYMNAPNETEAGRIIAVHRRQYLPRFRG